MAYAFDGAKNLVVPRPAKLKGFELPATMSAQLQVTVKDVPVPGKGKAADWQVRQDSWLRMVCVCVVLCVCGMVCMYVCICSVSRLLLRLPAHRCSLTARQPGSKPRPPIFNSPERNILGSTMRTVCGVPASLLLPVFTSFYLIPALLLPRQ